MKVDELQMSFLGMDPTESIKGYAREKFKKVENFLDRAVKAEIVFKEMVHSRGVNQDFRIDIDVFLPNSIVRVQEVGEDMYAIIDKAIDVLSRRLKRYYDKLSQWEGKKPWKAEEFANSVLDIEEEEFDNYADYIPKITVHKTLTELRPMETAEAIEEMELMGFRQMLFKNKDSKYCMIYRREDGSYGLVEPADEI